MFVHTITAHGAPFIAEKTLGSHDVVSGYSAAKHWAKDVPPDARRINLLSCYSAAGGPFSNAQMLANRTGLVVSGYPERICNLDNSSDSVRFVPQSQFLSSVSGKVNKAIAASKI